MKIISLYPYQDVYQVVDENDNVLFQGKKMECKFWMLSYMR